MKKKIRVGLDFDGVIAYNPFRIIRAPISLVKRILFKKKKLSFFYPKTDLERFIWLVLHESSILPAQGVNLLRELVNSDRVEAHLITARYSFLDKHLMRWLRRHKLEQLFTTITWNKNNEQPHLYKEKKVRERNLDYFIEDNLDIVRHVNGKVDTKIYWIYNILDRNVEYKHKHAHLENALLDIMRNSKVKTQKLKIR